MQPLAGTLVIELAQDVAGPFCGRLLGELGARVVKIEPHPQGGYPGDRSRRHGPFPPDAPGDAECSGLYLYCNAGKESVALDVRSEAGREQARRLASQADVLIEDWPPQETKRLGLDYASLAAENPALVQVSITPFGQEGPYAGWRAECLTIAHAGGEGYMLPPAIGHPRERWAQRPPVQAGGLIAGYAAGLLAADAVLAALLARHATGAGAHIDLSRWEAELHANRLALDLWLNRGKLSGRYTIEEPNQTLFPCKDGWVFLTFHRDEQFTRLASLAGRPEWLRDPRFANAPLRRANLPAIHADVIAWLAGKTGGEVFDLMESRGMLVAYFPTAKEVLRSAQAKAIGLFGEVEAPDGRRVTAPRPLYFLPETHDRVPMAPRLGEHTEEVARDLSPQPSLPRGERALRAGAGARPYGQADLSPQPSPLKRERGQSSARQPLAGCRILDFTWVAAGPVATHLLACLGAEVIKVESRAKLDTARFENFVILPGADPDISPDFNAINWNKRSVTLDLKRPEALDVVYSLVRICDAVVDNMRPGVMESLGLGHEALRQVNPAIVTVSASGFGPAGPRKDYPGIAAVFAGTSGLSAVSGHPDGPPCILQLPVDMRAGASLALALLAALLDQRTTGQGRHIDLASYASIACLIGHTFAEVSLTGRNPPRLGNGHPLMAPHGVYRCKGDDQWVSIAVASDEEWRALCKVVGRPKLAHDRRYASAAARRKRQEELTRVIESWTARRSPDEASRRLQAAGVAAMPSMSNKRIAEDGHLASRDFWVTLEHPRLGRTRGMRAPWRVAEWPAVVRYRAPLLGEHTREVLTQELGMSKEHVDALAQARALQ